MIINVGLGKDSYDIVLERGALNRVGELLNLNRRVLIVTDSGVPEQYSRRVADFCDSPFIVTVPQGESSKSIKVWESLLGKMLEESFTRSDAVVAVGGGVVGDLAGFAAASFMRGIDFYNIPTTLLSQVDSSVGGKTAVNFGGIKNIVGAFYQPKKVIIDCDVLKTLAERQLSAGLAESIKMAACFDSELFEEIENEDAFCNIEKIVEKSIRIKAAVVEKDEKESSLRRVLNFGHTVAHGIESQGGLYHGECVALGMLPVCSAEVRERLEKVLKKYSLPVKCEADADKILAAMEHDKKLSGQVLNLVTVDKIGHYNIEKIALEDFKKTVKENF